MTIIAPVALDLSEIDFVLGIVFYSHSIQMKFPLFIALILLIGSVRADIGSATSLHHTSLSDGMRRLVESSLLGLRGGAGMCAYDICVDVCSYNNSNVHALTGKKKKGSKAQKPVVSKKVLAVDSPIGQSDANSEQVPWNIYWNCKICTNMKLFFSLMTFYRLHVRNVQHQLLLPLHPHLQ